MRVIPTSSSFVFKWECHTALVSFMTRINVSYICIPASELVFVSLGWVNMGKEKTRSSQADVLYLRVQTMSTRVLLMDSFSTNETKANSRKYVFPRRRVLLVLPLGS